jgi:hypothetical protein|tara:strand:- start:124 stop:315 length:192 start_codon:yes stop_codon:yes gene_type:complete
MTKGIEKMYQTRARTKKGEFVGDDPSTSKNEAWVSKGKSFWDIVVELKGTNKRKSFYEWLTNG